MRDDMHEVIIERPRLGSRMGHFRRARRMDAKVEAARDPESLPLRIGLARSARHAGQTKCLNENLAPLRRYLRKQVNRPWNKVWSEVSANLKAANTVQQHVRDHVEDIVATRTYCQDGVVWAGGRRHCHPEPLAERWWLELYVDPRTGILRRNKHYRTYSRARRDQAAAAERERAARMREFGPLLQVHRLKGCWWVVTLARAPHVSPPGTDVVIAAGLTALPAHELYGRYFVYAVAKRQLSRAEIVRLGLKS